MQVQIIFNNNKEGIYPFINIGYLRRKAGKLTLSELQIQKILNSELIFKRIIKRKLVDG